MFDPTIGRWTTEDPIGLSAGDADLYRYVGNDPANVIDPTGMSGRGLGKGTWQYWWNGQAGLKAYLDDAAASGPNPKFQRDLETQYLDGRLSLDNIPYMSFTWAENVIKTQGDGTDAPPLKGRPPLGLIIDSTPAEKRVLIRHNLEILKATIVDKIGTMLTQNPPTATVLKDNVPIEQQVEVTDKQREEVANLIADAYIRAVDSFLKTHIGATPMLGTRSFILEPVREVGSCV